MDESTQIFTDNCFYVKLQRGQRAIFIFSIYICFVIHGLLIVFIWYWGIYYNGIREELLKELTLRWRRMVKHILWDDHLSHQIGD